MANALTNDQVTGAINAAADAAGVTLDQAGLTQLFTYSILFIAREKLSASAAATRAAGTTAKQNAENAAQALDAQQQTVEAQIATLVSS